MYVCSSLVCADIEDEQSFAEGGNRQGKMCKKSMGSKRQTPWKEQNKHMHSY